MIETIMLRFFFLAVHLAKKDFAFHNEVVSWTLKSSQEKKRKDPKS
jgi:hypothetical protein